MPRLCDKSASEHAQPAPRNVNNRQASRGWPLGTELQRSDHKADNTTVPSIPGSNAGICLFLVMQTTKATQASRIQEKVAHVGWARVAAVPGPQKLCHGRRRGLHWYQSLHRETGLRKPAGRQLSRQARNQGGRRPDGKPLLTVCTGCGCEALLNSWPTCLVCQGTKLQQVSQPQTLGSTRCGIVGGRQRNGAHRVASPGQRRCWASQPV